MSNLQKLTKAFNRDYFPDDWDDDDIQFVADFLEHVTAEYEMQKNLQTIGKEYRVCKVINE
jgi:uncharacterized protein YktA (UPF0223 family)